MTVIGRICRPDYTLYDVLCVNSSNMRGLAVVAASSEERIPSILKEHIRENLEIPESPGEVEDIEFKVLGFLDTGYKTDKEGVVNSPYCKFLDLFIGSEKG